MQNIKSSLTLGSMITLLLSSTPSYSAGLEKSISWSGRYAGIAGAAVSSVEGSESLYFNPANLATTQGAEVSGNFSTIFPQFSAPYTSSTSVAGNRAFKPAFGAFASYKATDKLVIGIGAYAAGGGAAEYDNVNLTGAGLSSAFTPTIQANLALIEYSLGAGYEILDGLRIGAAWRVLHASGTIGTLVPIQIGASTTIMGTTYDNLSGTRYNGFRLGASYAPRGAHWGIGATWRSSVSATLQGTSSASVNVGTGSTAPVAATGNPVTVSNVLPYQITLGGHYDIIPNEWKVFFQYDFNHYSVDTALVISGSATLPPALGGTSPNYININQNWNNLQIARIGTEYVLSKDLTLRGGYVYTGQVTPTSTPNPNFYAPGVGSTFVLGVGNYTWIRNLALNLTAEYSFNSGDAPAVLSTSVGTYKENDYSFHLGATYQL